MKIIKFFNFHFLLGVMFFLFGCKAQQVSTLSSANSESENVLVTSTAPDLIDNPTVIPFDEISVQKPLQGLKAYTMQKDVEGVLEKSEVFSSHFTGFSLFDINRNEYIVNYNADKYFTPASNVKVLTLYASLKSFGRKLPGMMYRESSDTLFFRPIGDPTFLHQFFSYQPVMDIMKNTGKAIAIEWPDKEISPFGIGWMWDDYSYSFQPELSWMPLYGNVVHFDYNKATVKATPTLFDDLIEVTRGKGESNTIRRAVNYNYYYADIRYRQWAFEKDVPFKYSKALIKKLLSDVVHSSVTIIPEKKLEMDTLYSQPIDTVLRRMMQESDNFIAEQLLIMAAWKNGFDNTEDFREFMIANWLPGIEPIWKDGSGISRYNLIRPIDEVRLLNKLFNEFGWTRIHNIFAHGGRSGTLKDWYPNRTLEGNYPEEPYIIAKTGTLSNNHTLSGYLQTKSGELLIFSFMNNNYVRETNEVKVAMQELLEGIRDSY